jgi:hypothetical protein
LLRYARNDEARRPKQRDQRIIRPASIEHCANPFRRR